VYCLSQYPSINEYYADFQAGMKERKILSFKVLMSIISAVEDNRSIAIELKISNRAATCHITNLLKKLDVDSQQ